MQSLTMKFALFTSFRPIQKGSNEVQEKSGGLQPVPIRMGTGSLNRQNLQGLQYHQHSNRMRESCSHVRAYSKWSKIGLHNHANGTMIL